MDFYLYNRTLHDRLRDSFEKSVLMNAIFDKKNSERAAGCWALMLRRREEKPVIGKRSEASGLRSAVVCGNGNYRIGE